MTKFIFCFCVFLIGMAQTLAAPPATTASCEGIQAAYPRLGRDCSSQYAKIKHAPTSGERLETYKARVEVMRIFKKATLCNGIYRADKSAQQRFASGMDGHLQAAAQLYAAMKNEQDSALPKNEFTRNDLNALSMTKAQCDLQ